MVLSLAEANLESYVWVAVTSLVLQRSVLALLLLAGNGSAASPSEPVEPRYDGRPLSYWLLDLAVGGHPNEELRARSEQAVRSIATNAIPFLIGRFARPSVNPHENWGAAMGFEVLGPIARPAVPRLIELLPVYIRSTRVLKTRPFVLFRRGN